MERLSIDYFNCSQKMKAKYFSDFRFVPSCEQPESLSRNSKLANYLKLVHSINGGRDIVRNDHISRPDQTS